MKNVLLLIKEPIKDYYFIRLNEELQKLGVKLIFFKKFNKLFPIIRNILSSKSRILHIHWFFIIGFDSKNFFKVILKSLLFMTEIFLIKHLLKVKIVWTVHNLLNHDSSYPNFETLFKKIFSINVDLITCHCEVAKEKLHRIFSIPPNKIIVIPHGNYLNCYKNDITQENARNYLKIAKNVVLLLHFGRIRPYKGTDMLIKSFNNLKSETQIKLIIAGKVSDQEYKQRLIDISKENNNIIFRFEFISDDDIQVYMNAADIVVTPYKRILTSGEVLLAMTFGKAIVAPKLGCISNILNNNGAFLYDPKEREGLFNALKKTVNCFDRIREMGEYNLNLVRKYDWKIIAKKFKKIYS